FHPDALTFGDEIALSALVAAAQSVPGVAGVEGLTVATPDEVYAWPEPDGAGGVTPGPVIRLGPLEVARLDNDPAAPAHGTLTLELRGGR
ncbi:MAG TPA: hypothetical protein VFL91_19945, partial [Thermomicrobiales bacterium]|nr:hypothetical protein [Thermomicrobiales bacterium]